MEEKIEFFDQNDGLTPREIRFFETLKNEHCCFFFYNITLNNSWLLFNIYLLKTNYGLTALEN